MKNRGIEKTSKTQKFFIDFRLKMMRATFLAHSLMADLDDVSLFFITFIVVLTSFNCTNML